MLKSALAKSLFWEDLQFGKTDISLSYESKRAFQQIFCGKPCWMMYQSFILFSLLLRNSFVLETLLKFHLFWSKIKLISSVFWKAKLTYCSLVGRHLGYFHLVGVIFTLWSKIYPSKNKMKWAAFCTVTGLHFFGKLTQWFIFESSRNFPLNEETGKLVINRNF